MTDDESDQSALTRRHIIKNGVGVVLGVGSLSHASAQSTANKTATEDGSRVIVTTTEDDSRVIVGVNENPNVPNDVNIGPPTSFNSETVSVSPADRDTNTVSYWVKSVDRLRGLNYKYVVYVSWGYTDTKMLWVNAAGQNGGTGNGWSYVGPYKEWFDYKTNYTNTRVAAVIKKWGEYDHRLFAWAAPWVKIYVNHQGNHDLVDYGKD